MPQYEQQDTHDHEYDEADHAICEDGAVIVSWRCIHQPGSIATDYERDETYFCPSGTQCEHRRAVRFEATLFLLDGKEYAVTEPLREWQDPYYDAYSTLVPIEFDPSQEPVQHENVSDCDVGYHPEDSHGRIVLETDTEYGHLTGVFTPCEARGDTETASQEAVRFEHEEYE